MAEENTTPQTEIEIEEELIDETIDQTDVEDANIADAEESDVDESDVEAAARETDAEQGEAEESTLTFKRSHVYAALLPLALVIGLALGYLFWGRPAEAAIAQAVAAAQSQQAQTQPAAAEETAPRRYDVPEDDDPVWGPDDAPITIIEFSDYECPYCRKWHTQIWPLIQEAYPNQIRLVYRDFPLTNIHFNATSAATAANCAFEQDLYWEFSEKLFSAELELNKESYLQYAEALGLDMDAFNECLESGRHEAEVMADLDYAMNLGVSSTPTFFINGIPIVGAQPFEVFKNVIDSELAGELP